MGSVPEPFADVGEFRQGTPASRWALARYLVGRALAESVSRALLLVALVVLALAIGVGAGLSSPFWGVVLALVAVAILAMRAVLRAVLIRLSPSSSDPALDVRLRSLVADTRADVLAELRRLGLPGRTWSLPLLGFRLASRRRRDSTLDRLRGFEVDRVVPAVRLDELHLLLQSPPERF